MTSRNIIWNCVSIRLVYMFHIENDLDFIPHYISFSFFSGPQSRNISNCYYNGVYCLFPVNVVDKYKITDARLIILENLRQKCIYLKSATSTYLDYMQFYYTNCLLSKIPKFNKECSNEVMELLKINVKNIEACIVNSFYMGMNDMN